jgi:hypothetical protein
MADEHLGREAASDDPTLETTIALNPQPLLSGCRPPACDASF